MFRQFSIIALGVSLVVTAACNNGGNKRVALRKSKTGANGKASDTTNKINAAIADAKCLRIDKLINEYIKLKDETILIYTSDVNIGLYGAVGGTDVAFNGETDLKVRANAVLHKTGLDPVIESIPAQKLQTSSIESLMSVVSMDQKCEVVAIRGVAETPNFDVIKKSSSELVLRNQRNPSVVLRYQYNSLNKLTVTRYLPDSNYCGKQHNVKMTKYVVAREAAMEKLEIDRGYATAIAENIDEPVEMKNALANNVSSVFINLSLPTMTQVRQALSADGFSDPACPTK